MGQARINYYKISLKTMDEIKEGERPSLLLHSCCGPCACWPLLFLSKKFDVTIYFNNSNIYPSSEYYRRLEELKKLLTYIERDYGYKIGLVVTPYDNASYNKALEPYKADPEGGRRCKICYEKRMKEAYDYAEKNGFAYFCTVMSISRQKSSQVMNEIGKKLEAEHTKTRYFYSDFKKANGILLGKELRLKYNLYNQNYCGCVYSYEKRLAYDKQKELEK